MFHKNPPPPKGADDKNGASRNGHAPNSRGSTHSRGMPPSGVISAVPALLPPPPKLSAPAPSLPRNTGGAKGRASDLFLDTLSLDAQGGAGAEPASAGLPPDIEQPNPDQPAVIQFVNRVLAQAILRRASDIHCKPRRDRLDIGYRIDGTLHDVDCVPHHLQEACTSRLKIMADMNIAERRLPQDGRIAVTMEGRGVDLRVSSLPTQYGESVVLRILDKGGTRPSLDQLGFSPANLDALNRVIRKPHGIFLATGPTGSGKTTTLYSAIQAIHTNDVNILTVEDPVEYELEGICQSNVHEKAGLTFARQLRAILRQDPDVIYVGEIRDAETAEVAFRAALTGHLVFSTLHCNDAAGAVTRLLNMGVDPFLVASSVIGVLAQRLVRKVCCRCAQAVQADPADLAAFGIAPDDPELLHAQLVAGAGCEACGRSGFSGRHSVQELMVMTEPLRELTLSRAPSTQIRRAAIAGGMIPMRADAAQKVLAGVTTFAEAQKRVFVEDERQN